MIRGFGSSSSHCRAGSLKGCQPPVFGGHGAKPFRLRALQFPNSKGFTLPELLALAAAGAILAGLLAPDLTQTQGRLMEDACVANLRHWGMAIYLYAQDNRGVTCDSFNPLSSLSAYAAYFPNRSTASQPNGIQWMRMCPAVPSSYSGTAGFPPNYATTRPCGNVGNNYTVIANQVWVKLQGIPRPDEYALMMDAGTFTPIYYANLYSSVSPAFGRHPGGGINVLFADLHVSMVTSNFCRTQSMAGAHSPWFASQTPSNTSFVISYY